MDVFNMTNSKVLVGFRLTTNEEFLLNEYVAQIEEITPVDSKSYIEIYRKDELMTAEIFIYGKDKERKIYAYAHESSFRLLLERIYTNVQLRIERWKQDQELKEDVYTFLNNQVHASL